MSADYHGVNPINQKTDTCFILTNTYRYAKMKLDNI